MSDPIDPTGAPDPLPEPIQLEMQEGDLNQVLVSLMVVAIELTDRLERSQVADERKVLGELMVSNHRCCTIIRDAIGEDDDHMEVVFETASNFRRGMLERASLTMATRLVTGIADLGDGNGESDA